MPRKFSIHMPDDVGAILQALEKRKGKSSAGVIIEAIRWLDTCDVATSGGRISTLIVTFPEGKEVRCRVPGNESATSDSK